MRMRRRTFVGASTAVLAAGLVPRAVLAAWPESAFKAQNVSGALEGLLGSATADTSGEIKIKAPDIAENGAVVPVTVTTTLGDVESISIVAVNNNQPLTSNYVLGSGTEGFVSTRIKMAKTSEVIAVVKSGGGLYTAQKEVKVTIGGCGG